MTDPAAEIKDTVRGHPISIIYTTRDDPWLSRSLAALRDVDRTGLAIQVVVILHGSEAAFAQRIIDLVAQLDMDIVVGYLAGGSTIAAARNCGALLAGHETLLFLDSDCVLRPDALQALRGKRIGVANGRVEFAATGSWFSRHNCRMRELGYRSLRGRLAYMPNLVIDRALFDRLHGFRAGLPCGEDFEFGDRIMRCGSPLEFLPRLRVTHLDDRRAGKTVKNWFRNGWGAGARRLLDAGRRWPGLPPALFTPEQRLAHGPGYAAVSTLAALTLTAGYLTCLLTSRWRIRPQWTRMTPVQRPAWVYRTGTPRPRDQVGVP